LIAGNVSYLDETGHSDPVMAWRETSTAALPDFVSALLGATATTLADGATLFVCADLWYLGELLVAANRQQLECKDLIFWTKTGNGMGTFYTSHEHVLGLKRGQGPHVELCQYGRLSIESLDVPGGECVEQRSGRTHHSVSDFEADHHDRRPVAGRVPARRPRP
jgi:hypothetical protein